MSALRFPMPTLGYIDGRDLVEDVLIADSAAHKEYRSTWQTAPRYRYRIKVDSLRSDAGSRLDFQTLFNFYARHRGPLDSFLLSDPEDQAVTDMGFAVGDGIKTAFPLQRTLLGSIGDAAGFSYPTQSKPFANMVKNSSFETDTNADGVSDSWLAYNSTAATEPTTATIVPGANGGKAQRVSWGTNSTGTKGVTQNSIGSPAFVAGQWYTISVLARASGSNVGKFLTLNWNTFPNTTIVSNNPALSGAWQRYVWQVFWNVGTSPVAEMFLTLNNVATSAFVASATFGDLDFDEVLVLAGQYDATTLPQPNATPAAATATDTPAYWPAIGDGFEPIFELAAPPTIYQDGDWGFGSGAGKRTLYPYARTNLLPFSEQIDNAAWTKTNATVTPNTTVAPDGTTTAETISEGAAVTVQHGVSESAAADIAGELRCWSIFVKANNLPNIFISAVAAFIEGVKFNLGTGVIDGLTGTAASGVTTDPRWPGWYRVWFVRRGTATGTGLFVNGCLDGTYSSAGYTGTSRTFFAWGAMCERVSNLLGPTPYIKTASSVAVTTTDYTVDSLGNVTPATVLPAGAFLSADLSYYRRVRFEDQDLTAQRIAASMWGSGLGLISCIP